MKKTLAVVSALLTFVVASPASAQATRTWVSGVGDDANPCSRTAPCKTFAGAISKTAAGGEINCLDPGGFGGVTITKALSIVCGFTEGGILSAGAGVNGIIINAGVNDNIYLSGLDLHGAGNAQNGIRFLAGASLTIENSSIRAYNATNGRGISFQPGGSSRLYVINTTISNNGTSSTGGGILIQPTGAGGVADVHIVNSRVYQNGFNGIRVESTGNTNAGPNIVAIEGSAVGGSNEGVVVVTDPTVTPALVTIMNSNVNHNTTALHAFGTRSTIHVGLSTFTGNITTTTLTNSGIIRSYGNNRAEANTNLPTFTAPNLTQQ